MTNKAADEMNAEGGSEAVSRSFDIRPVNAGDHDPWLSLWRAYQRFYKVDIPATVTFETWGRLLNPTEPMHAALAIADGRTLGLVHYIYHRSTWTIGDYCYLQDLYVASEARGSGIGRRLIEHVYSEAEKCGVARVYWTTHETNLTAMQLYDRLAEKTGFIQYRKLLT